MPLVPSAYDTYVDTHRSYFTKRGVSQHEINHYLLTAAIHMDSTTVTYLRYVEDQFQEVTQEEFEQAFPWMLLTYPIVFLVKRVFQPATGIVVYDNNWIGCGNEVVPPWKACVAPTKPTR